MNGTNIIGPIINKFNAIAGLVVGVLSYVLGEHWFLFLAYLLLNIADYVTGCIKSRINQTTSSQKGTKGAVKKLGYWIMILVAFGMSGIFIELGNAIGINLQVTTLIGWFVLGTLIINELRSILENFVEAGYSVPPILIKGLEVANKAVSSTADKIVPDAKAEDETEEETNSDESEDGE